MTVQATGRHGSGPRPGLCQAVAELSCQHENVPSWSSPDEGCLCSRGCISLVGEVRPVRRLGNCQIQAGLGFGDRSAWPWGSKGGKWLSRGCPDDMGLGLQGFDLRAGQVPSRSLKWLSLSGPKSHWLVTQCPATCTTGSAPCMCSRNDGECKTAASQRWESPVPWKVSRRSDG